MTTIRKLASIAAMLLLAGTARAAPPKTITYGGFLLDSTGAPVGGSSTLTFRLYDAPTAGNVLYTEVQGGILPSAADGYFSVTIGLGTFLPDLVFQNQTYLGVQYGVEAEMTPRIRVSSVPSAFTAVNVDWSGIQNRPISSCSGATPFVTGIDANGVVTCGAGPSGAAGCSSGQVMKWTGSAWTCQPDSDTTYGATAPLVLTGNTFSMAAASATTAGYLSSTDWNAFNSRLSSVTTTGAPLSGAGTSGSPLSIAAANGSTAGYLSAADWNTFNTKLGAVATSAPLSGSGTGGSPLAISAANSTTAGYLTVTDWNTFSNKVSAVGVATNGGLVVSGTTNPFLSLTTSCGNGQVLKWSSTASSWQCQNDTVNAGTVTNVTAAAPLSVATGTTTPAISIAACATNQILKYNGTAWACAADVDTDTNSGGTVTSITAGAGLTGGTITSAGTIAPNFTTSGGDSGTATTVARGDHVHDGRYYQESELNTAGTINTTTNPVDWTKLKNVPAAVVNYPRFSHSSTYATVGITGACAAYTSVSITVPGPGTIAIQAQNMISIGTMGLGSYLQVGIGSTTTECTDYPGIAYFQLPTSAANTYLNATEHRAFAVSSAGTYTYYITGLQGSPSVNSMWFYYGRLFATFYPN